MRLRLSVLRHCLPPTNIIFSIPAGASAQAYTIVRLLEDVNSIIPLEAEEWGLEDYVVEVRGFECLHFSPAAQVLKDEDVVTIRPLATAEVRARTLCGRDQISEDGRHLFDGVPFGRPLLRPPTRPQIRIPPRQQQALREGEGEAELGDLDPASVLLLEEAHPNCPQESGAAGRKRSADDEHPGPATKKAKASLKSVHFDTMVEEDLDSEDEDDLDFAPGGLDDDSDTDKESGSEDDEDSADAFHSSSSESESDSDSDSDSSSSDSDSNSSSGGSTDSTESESETSVGDKIQASKPHITKPTPPGKGKLATKVRNSRRAQSKKLKHLKQIGVLPPEANMAAYKEWMAMDPEVRRTLVTNAEVNQKARSTQEHVMEVDAGADAPNGSTASYKRKHPSDEALLQEQRKRLLAQLEQTTTEVQGAPSPEPTPKRLRPDVSTVARVPDSSGKHVEKQAAEPKPVTSGEVPAPADPDFWKSRINLSAYECWHQDYTLGPPPFPFKQHWDPASQVMRKKALKNKKKNANKRANASEGLQDNPDRNPQPALNLNYGDSDAFQPSSEEPSDPGAAIESQLQRDAELAALEKADLPPLPKDVTALPELRPADVKVGAIVVFKHFTLNPVNMNPEISGYKTARVEHEGDSGNGAGVIDLKLAARDMKAAAREKKFDKHGNRILSHAEMLQMGDEDSDEDEGHLSVHFGELLEARLLAPAKAA